MWMVTVMGSLSHAQDVVKCSLAIPDGILFCLDEHIKNRMEWTALLKHRNWSAAIIAKSIANHNIAWASLTFAREWSISGDSNSWFWHWHCFVSLWVVWMLLSTGSIVSLIDFLEENHEVSEWCKAEVIEPPSTSIAFKIIAFTNEFVDDEFVGFVEFCQHCVSPVALLLLLSRLYT